MIDRRKEAPEWEKRAGEMKEVTTTTRRGACCPLCETAKRRYAATTSGRTIGNKEWHFIDSDDVQFPIEKAARPRL